MRAFSLLLFFLSLAAAQARWDEHFTARRKIVIDTGATGQPIAGPIGGATVLVRLHDGNFQFEAAKEDGSDLRFIAADDKTPLPFHLEKYDSLLHEGLAWVKLPDIAAGNKSELWLYYGNPAAERAGDPKASYDSDTVLVYHFDESNAAPADVTASANAGQGSAVTTRGLIGNGLRLGPAAVTIPASPSLAWTEGAALTWSAWVKVTAPVPGGLFFSRPPFAVGADDGTPFVSLGAQQARAAASLPPGTWHHLAVVARAGQLTLYVDGDSAATLAVTLPALNNSATLGGDNSAQGELDELEISRVARSEGWLKLAAIGQAGEKAAKLITFGDDEKAAGHLLGDGYFAIILRNLTVDGWVVIAILAVMAVITWIVVILKWRYLAIATAANRAFQAEWQRLRGDLGQVEDDPALFGQALPPDGRRALARSPLFAVFRVGMQEVAHRMALRAGEPKSLSSRGLQAIRAELDTGLMLESERLNSGIVLLTIAISGGPFLGLLGTVVGVMITFAAVAAAGEVNVNAIAPGIAAALLATVAGLAVAIPALFAYNYLLTRIKSATRDLNVFIESFITRMAEQYRGAPAD